MQKCLLESQASEPKFFLKQKISGISIFAWDLGFMMVMVKLLKVTPVMRMMKNITQRVLCLKVGKENIKAAEENIKAAEEEEEE